MVLPNASDTPKAFLGGFRMLQPRHAEEAKPAWCGQLSHDFAGIICKMVQPLAAQCGHGFLHMQWPHR